MSLIALVLVIVWAALSMAYCVTRRYNDPTMGKKPVKKQPKQKFEEYWGEMDSTTNSTTALNAAKSSSMDTSTSSDIERPAPYTSLPKPEEKPVQAKETKETKPEAKAESKEDKKVEEKADEKKEEKVEEKKDTAEA